MILLQKDYIKNRICYEEEIVTELGKTFEIWQSLVKNSQGKIDYQNTPISYKIKDRIYTNVTGQYIADSRLVYATDIVSDYIFILGKDTSFTKEGGTIEAYYKNEVGDTEKTTDFQFVKIENTVKQIDSKFIPTASPDWSVNDETDPSYVKNRVGYYAEKKAAEKSTTSTVDVNEHVTFILTFPDDNIDVYTINSNKDHLYLYYKAKRYPLIRSNYTGGTSTYNYKTIIPENNVFITFTFTTSTAAKVAHVIFNNESSRKITIEPGDLYITIPDPVEIPYDLIPLAGQRTRGGIKVDDISEPDGTSAYLMLDPETERLWYSPSIMGNIRSNILTKTILTNIVDQAGKTLICGSSDDTVSELNLMASNNFPVTVTYVGYEGTYPPTFIYLISTADGKRGKFTYAVSSQTLSPITWTFEGGGGGNSLFIITPTYDSDTKTWSTDRTWDEVKAAVAKSENPNDYAIRLDRLLIPPNGLIVNRNSSGEIAPQAFDHCDQLATVNFPDTITIIDSNAFQACLAFNTEKLPNGLTELGSMVFSSCKSLTLANIPAGIKTIGAQAFYNCTGLTALTFQGTPTTIAADAFEGCTNLTTINVPWAEGTVANAPWGATNATINYNYTGA